MVRIAVVQIKRGQSMLDPFSVLFFCFLPCRAMGFVQLDMDDVAVGPFKLWAQITGEWEVGEDGATELVGI